MAKLISFLCSVAPYDACAITLCYHSNGRKAKTMAIQCVMTMGQANKILAIVRAIACANRMMREAQLNDANYDRGKCEFTQKHDALVNMLQAYTGGNYWGSEVAEELDKLHSSL